MGHSCPAALTGGAFPNDFWMEKLTMLAKVEKCIPSHLLSPRGEDEGEGDIFGHHPHPNPLPPAGEGGMIDFHRLIFIVIADDLPWPLLRKLGMHFLSLNDTQKINN